MNAIRGKKIGSVSSLSLNVAFFCKVIRILLSTLNLDQRKRRIFKENWKKVETQNTKGNSRESLRSFYVFFAMETKKQGKKAAPILQLLNTVSSLKKKASFQLSSFYSFFNF